MSAMSIRGMSRAVGIAAAIAGLLAGGAARADDPPGSVVVVGTGDPTQDVPAVQEAVDQGGTVILRGTFDFGSHAGNHIIVPGRAGSAQDEKGESTVFIYQNDVTVLGETDAHGTMLTTIRNGMPPFWIGWDGIVSREQPPGTYNEDFGMEVLPVDSDGRVSYRDSGPEPGYQGPQIRYARAFPDVSATIQKIYFDSPWHFGIKATAGKDVSILDNVFRNVQWGGLVHLNTWADATHIAAGFVALGAFYAPFLYPAITGTVVIEGNLVDDVGTEPINTHWGESLGLGAVNTDAAAMTITGNEVRNVGRKPDGTVADALGASIATANIFNGAPLISRNTISNSSLFGIWDQSVFVYLAPAPVIIHNTIANCPYGIETGSWGVPKSGVIIRSNTISQDDFFGWLGIEQYNSDGYYIGQNRFIGEFCMGVGLFNSSNDSIVGNNVSELITPVGCASYFLDENSCGNTIRGNSGTAFVAGWCENYITGVARMAGAPPPGPMMSETQQRILEGYRSLVAP
jgi:hypothetical protein